jgi:GNAT superfamily N-acetyltransferase
MVPRLATGDDWRSVGAVVGRAFADDPVSQWTLGTAEAIEHVFTVLCRDVYLARGGGATADARGGAMWLRPGGSKSLPWLGQATLAVDLLRGPGVRQVLRALAVDAAMQRRRPTTAHCYLFAVGVGAEGRGQGLGGAMIGLMTAQADRDGVPCWLENTNPRNEPLYRRLGFAPVETFSPAPGCPPVTTMQRAPSPSARA